MQDSWEMRTYTGVPPQGTPIDEKLQLELLHGYYACVSYMDAQLGKVLDELDRTGLAQNTIVVVWGDHGYHLGDHGMWCKHTNFEQATRSPLIVRVPGMAQGQNISALTEFVDVFPSLCDLCGLKSVPQFEGTSFLPLLANPGRAWKSAAFSQYPRGKDTLGRSMRTDRYRFNRWGPSNVTGPTDIMELYDYQNDPDETVNLAADDAYKPLVAEMVQRLDAGWRGAVPK